MTFPLALSHKSMADPLPSEGAVQPMSKDRDWLDDLFNEFFRAKIPTPQAYANARHQAEDVVHALRCALYPIRIAANVTGDSLIVGSVGKRTALSPITTVDVLYLLPSKLKVSRSAEAFKVVHAGLLDQFDQDSISTDDLGVLVSCTALKVRIIPALETGSGYKIPKQVTLNHAAGWQIANPISEAATLRLSDSLNTGATRRLLTLLKSWRENLQVPIPSLALDVLAQDYFATQRRQPNLQEDFRAFAAWGRSKTPGDITAPGAYTSLYVDDSWHGHAKAAYWRTTLAEQSVAQEPRKTVLEWRHLLGESFPVPEGSSETIPPILEACA